MISNLNDYNELNKILRQQILTQSGLANDHVINGLNDEGANLEKRLDEQIFVSFSLLDNFIVFQLVPRMSTSDISQTINNDIYDVSSFSFKLTIYGKSSMRLAQIIKSRFETEEVRNALYIQGVYLESISSPQPFNEFINSKVYIRTDLSINISCESKFEKIISATEMENISDITINVANHQIHTYEGIILGSIKNQYTFEGVANVKIDLCELKIYPQSSIVLEETYSDNNGNYLFTHTLNDDIYYIIRFYYSDGSMTYFMGYPEKINIIPTQYIDSVYYYFRTLFNILDTSKHYKLNLLLSTGIIINEDNPESLDGNIKYKKVNIQQKIGDTTYDFIAQTVVIESYQENINYKLFVSSDEGYIENISMFPEYYTRKGHEYTIQETIYSNTEDKSYWEILSIINDTSSIINTYSNTEPIIN